LPFCLLSNEEEEGGKRGKKREEGENAVARRGKGRVTSSPLTCSLSPPHLVAFLVEGKKGEEKRRKKKRVKGRGGKKIGFVDPQ